MTTFFDIDSANERIPEVSDVLTLLRDQRAELVGLRDRLLEIEVERPAETPADARGRLEEARLVRLKIRALVDQMSASVARIDRWGISLRDIESGLIDFPALVSGRQVWLCWRLGEGPIEWWHELDTGFSGRKRLIDLA